jgi:hypothetical protein
VLFRVGVIGGARESLDGCCVRWLGELRVHPLLVVRDRSSHYVFFNAQVGLLDRINFCSLRFST